MKISKEVKTGILALTAIVLVIFGYNFMKGQNILDSSREFYAVYEDIDGLTKSAGVTINGMKVGSVSGIKFLDESGRIEVEMNLVNDFQFSKNSIAEIYSDGFIGGKSVRIIPGDDKQAARAGERLNGRIEKSMLDDVLGGLDPLQNKIESALSGIDSLVGSLNRVLDKDGERNLKESLNKLSSTMTHLNKATSEIDKLLTNNSSKLDNTIGNISDASENLKKMSDSLAKIEVQPLVDKFEGVLNDLSSITGDIQNGKGTVGKLLQDEGIYDNLDRATHQLEELVQDIKLNPRRYIDLRFSIFGKKNKAELYEKPTDPLK